MDSHPRQRRDTDSASSPRSFLHRVISGSGPLTSAFVVGAEGRHRPLPARAVEELLVGIHEVGARHERDLIISNAAVDRVGDTKPRLGDPVGL